MLKNLKSLFIVDDSDDNKRKKPTPKKEVSQEQQPKKTGNTYNKIPSTTSTVSSEGIVDSKIVEKLLQAIEKNNLEGFDYLEYKKSIKALDKIPMDEATKYRSAFATASTMGVTLEKLLETVQFYIGILDKENTVFLNAFKAQLQEKVSDKEGEMTQLQSVIKEKTEQIKKLTEEITKHQAEVGSIKSKLGDSRAKIEKTQNDFKESFSYLKGQFEGDVIKMKDYLK